VNEMKETAVVFVVHTGCCRSADPSIRRSTMTPPTETKDPVLLQLPNHLDIQRKNHKNLDSCVPSGTV